MGRDTEELPDLYRPHNTVTVVTIEEPRNVYRILLSESLKINT